MLQAILENSATAARGFGLHPAFAAWPREALMALDRASVPVEFAKGATLYTAGDPVAGLYLLRSGEVKLLMPERDGKSSVSHTVAAGGTVGLGPTVSGQPYEFTARATSRCSAAFVPRQGFIAILRRFPEATLSVSHVLTIEIERAYRHLRGLRT
jgi:CRP-like cAMP-binding protein